MSCVANWGSLWNGVSKAKDKVGERETAKDYELLAHW